jgi:hypothetical protein
MQRASRETGRYSNNNTRPLQTHVRPPNTTPKHPLLRPHTLTKGAVSHSRMQRHLSSAFSESTIDSLDLHLASSYTVVDSGALSKIIALPVLYSKGLGERGGCWSGANPGAYECTVTYLLGTVRLGHYRSFFSTRPLFRRNPNLAVCYHYDSQPRFNRESHQLCPDCLLSGSYRGTTKSRSIYHLGH